jgi:hypothetical protein
VHLGFDRHVLFSAKIIAQFTRISLFNSSLTLNYWSCACRIPLGVISPLTGHAANRVPLEQCLEDQIACLQARVFHVSFHDFPVSPLETRVTALLHHCVNNGSSYSQPLRHEPRSDPECKFRHMLPTVVYLVRLSITLVPDPFGGRPLLKPAAFCWVYARNLTILQFHYGIGRSSLREPMNPSIMKAI